MAVVSIETCNQRFFCSRVFPIECGYKELAVIIYQRFKSICFTVFICTDQNFRRNIVFVNTFYFFNYNFITLDGWSVFTLSFVNDFLS